MTPSPDDVAGAYLLAWQEGCLGITVFRDGCKGSQVLNAGVRADGAPADAIAAAERVVKPRPHSLAGATYRMETPIGTAFVTVNDTPGGEPFEVFVQVGKAGSDTMAVAEALGRLVSLVLRLPSPLSARPPPRGGHQPALADRRRAADRLRVREGALAAGRARAGARGAHRAGGDAGGARGRARRPRPGRSAISARSAARPR